MYWPFCELLGQAHAVVAGSIETLVSWCHLLLSDGSLSLLILSPTASGLNPPHVSALFAAAGGHARSGGGAQVRVMFQLVLWLRLHCYLGQCCSCVHGVNALAY
jgi:hypothetical protein